MQRNLVADAMSTIRVLHVIDSLGSGGAQTALLNLVRATDRSRFAPEVATMHGRGIAWDDFAALGVPVHSLSPRKWLPLYLTRLARLIASRRPQIVHCHLLGANWIAKPLAAMLGVPVRINHDQCNGAFRNDHWLARRLDAWTNRFSSHVCAVSVSTRDFLVASERLDPRRVSLVYNAVDLSRFVPPAQRRRRGRFVVLGVGRLHGQKNFPLFLEVGAELLRRGHPVEFRIAGTGPEESALRALARRLRIADRVHFLGHVTDIAPVYAGADVLLMTSRFEGTPLVMLEAMAMRAPIVASRVDGIGEVLCHEKDALLIEPAGREHFVRAVERLQAEPDLAARLASAAHAKVHAGFSSQAMAAQVESIYERCLAEV